MFVLASFWSAKLETGPSRRSHLSLSSAARLGRGSCKTLSRFGCCSAASSHSSQIMNSSRELGFSPARWQQLKQLINCFAGSPRAAGEQLSGGRKKAAAAAAAKSLPRGAAGSFGITWEPINQSGPLRALESWRTVSRANEQADTTSNKLPGCGGYGNLLIRFGIFGGGPRAPRSGDGRPVEFYAILWLAKCGEARGNSLKTRSRVCVSPICLVIRRRREDFLLPPLSALSGRNEPLALVLVENEMGRRHGDAVLIVLITALSLPSDRAPLSVSRQESRQRGFRARLDSAARRVASRRKSKRPQVITSFELALC